MRSLAFDPAEFDLYRDGDGQVVRTTEPIAELLLALAIPRGSFYGDPEQGSRLREIVQGPPPANPKSAIEAAAREALARLEQAGVVTVVDVVFDPATSTLRVDTEELSSPFEMSL